jgi:hypothetical protein
MRRLGFCILYLALGSGLLLGQSYQGNLDGAGCGSIFGYAWNYTATPISVDIYDSTVYVTTVAANMYTGNSDSINPDGGYRGFSLDTPAVLKDNQIHSIYARYSGPRCHRRARPGPLQ